MEPPKKDDDDKQKEKAPGVPIKTYKWEDVRRSRQKGGYPWTHLYKGPFNENIDSEEFKLVKMSQPKSSTSLKSQLQIEEITNGVSEHDEEYPENVIVQDSDSSDHSKYPRNTSLIIREESEIELNLEEAESSDNISQYLDREERRADSVQKNNEIIPGPSKTDSLLVEATNGRTRAKSEEPNNKKRKLSVDSSYSRMSLPKLGILKRLKNTKCKIKVPKLPSSTNLKKSESNKKKGKEKETEKGKEKEKESVIKKDVKPISTKQKADEKPVYIHIPLKPPEGETDEFSYLEFEEKLPQKEPLNKVEVKPEEEIEPQKIEAIKSDIKFEAFDANRRFSETSNPDEIVAIEILKSESIDLNDNSAGGFNINSDHQDGDIFIIQKHPESSTNEDVAIIILGSDETRKQPSGSKSPTSSKVLKRENSRKVRAKSAEPERKRKPSIESSYSRKSLSKLAWLNKKLKEGKDKVKFPTCSLSSLFRTASKKKPKKEKDEPKIVQEVVLDVKKVEKQPITPQYIHIPLKPPEGQYDEFSYLEFEEIKEKKEKKTVKKEEESIDSTESPKIEENEDVQMIVLIPPSDDEILDDHAEIPETPLEDKEEFFEPKINELKEIAKDVADKLSPETKRKKLALLNQENNMDNLKMEETKEGSLKKGEKVIVDEEDGLKLNEPVVEKLVESKENKEELKPSLKGDVSPPRISPILKKKVSFKRRSKDDTKNGIYEDVQVAKVDKVEEKTVEIKNNSLMTDEEKIASSEEDPNKWSKSSDHYYEPVNPPLDDVLPALSPIVHIMDTDQAKLSGTAVGSTTSLDHRILGSHEGEPFVAQEIQTKIENKFLNKSPERTIIKTITEKKTTRTESPSPQRGDIKKVKSEGKFQQALKLQAGKFKTKLHGIKRPNISLPSRPKFEKPNLPKFNLPKIPDKTVINLPKFTKTRKTTSKQTLKQRQLSTESNAGDTKKNYFSFSTYPRFFKKKQTDDFESTSSKAEPMFATVPRMNKGDTSLNSKRSDRWGGSDSIRIPLHTSDSFDETKKNSKDGEGVYPEEMMSHIRYDEDIDIDDAYEKENQEIHSASPFSHNYGSRWEHGSFHPEHGLNTRFLDNLKDREYKVTDLDSPEDESVPPIPLERFDSNIHSSESSIHQRGVLEEIDSDEFFLRQKGISQDNIEVGAYLSSEIREAFKSPFNALSDIQVDPNNRYEIRESNQSLPESPTRRKVVKKPKRKKTPHVSQEKISYEQEDSEQEFSFGFPPSRPKRRSRKSKKTKQQNVVPYQETIPLESEFQKENLGILGKSDDEQYTEMYENEKMIGKDQPEINIIDPYKNIKYESERDLQLKPTPPKRRNKSLTNSEQDSILDYTDDNETSLQNMLHEYIIPTPEEVLSKHQRSVSHSSLQLHTEGVPKRPPRSRTRSLSSRGASQDETASRVESLSENQIPCVEEPCSKVLCDYMGYAVVDKDKKREPPLPPPRTPPRRKRSISNSNKSSSASELRFFTVPRQGTGSSPVRPLRNYSTLGPSRPPRRKPVPNMTDEEKENIDISQYIEIEDEPTRKLQSGDVIQKMRDRPLPAPPRPPRKSKAFNDITSEENIIAAVLREEKAIEETISTQTDPLSDDFVCEEVSDKVLTPTKEDDVKIERRIITPTHYAYEETVTHGSLLVQPLDGAKILNDSEISKREERMERTIPVRLENSDDETSEIPEDFKKLKSPKIKPDSNTEVGVLKAQKLQVTDLDVDRLSVNELLANRIVVSEIDSNSIQTNEISSKTGALKVGDIELPPSVVQQLFEKLQQSNSGTEESSEAGQKKTSIEPINPTKPPRKSPLEVEETVPQTDSLSQEEIIPPEPPERSDSSRKPETMPQRPPRQEKAKTEESDRLDEAERIPPRPPQPTNLEYIPSQPPASFYALRAQQYVDDGDIPMAPRRRRHHSHHHKQPLSRSSSSSESSLAQAVVSSRRRYRSPEPTIPELAGQLVSACGTVANNSLKRLIAHITNNILRNADGKQDLHVMIVILLVLIAGLILLGWGDEKTVHHHHWEYFNPPRDM